MGPLMYIFFGTVREISVGPNSVLALMINSYVSEGGVAYAVILAFLTGIIQLIIGLLNLGKISLTCPNPCPTSNICCCLFYFDFRLPDNPFTRFLSRTNRSSLISTFGFFCVCYLGCSISTEKKKNLNSS